MNPASPAFVPSMGLSPGSDRRPLIAHLIYRLAIGGLENGLVNLINRLPRDRFRHAVICLTDYTDFSERITVDDVKLYAMCKGPGHGLVTQMRVARLLYGLRPAVFHTRNLAALEYQPVAALLRIPVRIHSEHGRDLSDAGGTNWKYRAIRRAVKSAVHQYIAVSQDLQQYLVDSIGIKSNRITQIRNGVDTDRFQPAGNRLVIGPAGFANQNDIVVGTVGRMDAIKDPLNLVRGFIAASEVSPDLSSRLRLVMAGDGPLRSEALRLLSESGLAAKAWLPGAQSDVASLLRGFDIFVLPSVSEGVSNAILEAMASGLPVIATRVGGNTELVRDGATGMLVPRGDSDAIARGIIDYARQAGLRAAHSRAARHDAVDRFSLSTMVNAYSLVYERELADRNRGSLGSMVA